MMRFRIESARVAIAALIGAAFGAVFHLDQVIVGPEHYAEISDVVPAHGFFWLVLGSAAIAVALLLLAEGLQCLGRLFVLLDTDERHANHCMHRRRKYQAHYHCTCWLNPATWTPEQRRSALKVLDGGRQ